MNDWCKWHEHAPCILLWCPSSQLSIKICILQGKVSHYCLNRGNGNGTTPNSCAEATQADIDLLTSSMAACFKTAVAAGVNIAISPHLDDGLGLGELSAPEATAEICENGQWRARHTMHALLWGNFPLSDDCIWLIGSCSFHVGSCCLKNEIICLIIWASKRKLYMHTVRLPPIPLLS